MRQNTDLVTHHTHSVERRLTVKEYIVAIHEVAIHDITLKELEVLACDVLEGNHTVIRRPHNGLRTGIDIGAVLNQLVKFIDIE